jgi:hypothetical protein
MIYTDYFPRGAVPTETCPLHQGSLFNRFTALFRGSHAVPAPVAASAIGAPPRMDDQVAEAVSHVPASAPTVDQAEPAVKKKGFWSRLFGRRDKSKSTEAPPPKSQ